LNVRTLIGGYIIPHVLTFPEFTQLMDNDLVCLTGLTLLVHPSCRENFSHVAISQLSLSLYLMTQCQMKLHHPVTSFAHTFDYIEVARRKLGREITWSAVIEGNWTQNTEIHFSRQIMGVLFCTSIFTLMLVNPSYRSDYSRVAIFCPCIWWLNVKWSYVTLQWRHSLRHSTTLKWHVAQLSHRYALNQLLLLKLTER